MRRVVVVLCCAAVGLAAGCGSDSAEQSEPTPTAYWPTLPAPTGTAAARSTTATAAPTSSSSTSSAQRTPAALGPSDPRCAPASETVIGTVAAGLTKDGYRLGNALVIDARGLVFFGASILDAGGVVKERQDVWILRDGIPYSSTGGARNNTLFGKASTALRIGPDDADVVAVNRCVELKALGR